MTIQRQYNLPNCTLLLEGLGDPVVIQQPNARPLMTILVSAECRITDQTTTLSGGREFFESFVRAVSQYAQEVFSGIHRYDGSATVTPLVRFRKLGGDLHRLTVQPLATLSDRASVPPSATDIDLNTVQLFDLVEAVDQFFADTQTLPELALSLEPVSKRYIRSSEPIATRAVPVAVGLSGLALAAIAMSVIPIPKVNKPDCLKPDEQPKCTKTAGTPSASASPSSSPSPTTGSSPSSSPTESSGASSPSPSATTGTASPAIAPQSDLTKLESVLNTAPEITDSAQLDALGKQLYTQIDQAWKTRTPFIQDLVYRVGVGKDGAIVGYKPVNPAALTSAKQTPLLDLLYIPATGSRPESEPIAQFKVVFTPSGTLSVAPWKQVMASPLGGALEITDAVQLKELQPKLYDQIDKAWKDKPTFKSELLFRVRLKSDGTIADYKPETAIAATYAQDVPLAKLGKPLADGDSGSSQESLALFKVVFKPDGKLEVSPWRGR
jgi:hypothetical protein